MHSCLHLIQQTYKNLPWDALHSVAAQDVIVVMNDEQEETLTTLQSFIPKSVKVFSLRTDTSNLSANEISYNDLVSLVCEHKNSVSW